MGRGSPMKRVLKTVGKAAAGIGAAAAAAGLVLRSDLAAEGVKAGITLCLETVIRPSSPLWCCPISWRRAGGRGGYLPPLNGWQGVYHLPDAAAAALALGLVGGYPVGARMAAGLKREGRLDGREASALLCTAYGPSPTFLAGIGRWSSGIGKSGWSSGWRSSGDGAGGVSGRAGAPAAGRGGGKYPAARAAAVRAVCRERAVGERAMGVICGFTLAFAGAAAVPVPAAGGDGQVRRGLL